MSDADNQLGGTGGERGPEPEEVVPGKDNAAPVPAEDDEDEDEAAQSFPASDPPANY
jgi:hypothetical protein